MVISKPKAAPVLGKEKQGIGRELHVEGKIILAGWLKSGWDRDIEMSAVNFALPPLKVSDVHTFKRNQIS